MRYGSIGRIRRLKALRIFSKSIPIGITKLDLCIDQCWGPFYPTLWAARVPSKRNFRIHGKVSLTIVPQERVSIKMLCHFGKLSSFGISG